MCKFLELFYLTIMKNLSFSLVLSAFTEHRAAFTGVNDVALGEVSVSERGPLVHENR